MGFNERKTWRQSCERSGTDRSFAKSVHVPIAPNVCIKLTFQIELQVISGAGHHIFADKPEVFNQFVNEACFFSDNMPRSIESPSATSEFVTEIETADINCFSFTELQIEDIEFTPTEAGDGEQGKTPPNVSKVMTGIPVPDLLVKWTRNVLAECFEQIKTKMCYYWLYVCTVYQSDHCY